MGIIRKKFTIFSIMRFLTRQINKGPRFIIAELHFTIDFQQNVTYWQFSSIYSKPLTLHGVLKFYKAFTTLAFEIDFPTLFEAL